MDDKTQDFYRERGADWAAHLPHEWSPQLDPFLDRLNPGARILELGCGDGRDAARMIERGFNIHPSDGVHEMARMASERLNRKVTVLPFDQLAEDQAYDAVWAHASLLHVARDALPDVLRRVYRALRLGGFHFANFKGGEAGARDKFGRYYNYLSNEGLHKAYERAGHWTLLEFASAEGGSFDGQRLIWHDVISQR